MSQMRRLSDKVYYVYLMTNKINTVIYTGVTNGLRRRAQEHREKVNPCSFTAKYNVNKLVHYEGFQYIGDAIAREKQIKSWSRKKKQELIEKDNPEYRDLYDELE